MRRSYRVIASALGLTFALTACGARGGSLIPSTPGGGSAQVPVSVRLGDDMGKANASQVITATVYLKMRDAAGLAHRVDALYDPSSPTFHHWLTDADLRHYAAPEWQMDAVRETLVRQGLTVLSTDRDGFSIRVRGTVARMARAFQTQIHNFSHNGQTFQAPLTTPRLSGKAGRFVDTVSGLNNRPVQTMLARALDPVTRQPYPAISVAAAERAGGLKSLITDQSLSPSKTVNLTTPNAKYPKATYSGIVYQANPKLLPDFTAKELQEYYGLTADYARGLNGAGQTVVLVEAYDYPQMQYDASISARILGLPPLSPANLQVVYPEGKPNPTLGIKTGWQTEIALDVQWTHAIAPGAKIVVVATNGQDDEDLQYSMQYIVDHKLGYLVSDSWGTGASYYSSAAQERAYNNVLVRAAAKGVSFQFASGDRGDSGVGIPFGAASVPSDSPYATAVGGTSILNNVGGSGFSSIGWGNGFTELYNGNAGVLYPLRFGFEIGSGGGSSLYLAKPKWQAALPGSFRQTPDVSALADPYTGVPVVESGVPPAYPGPGGKLNHVLEPGWGGTSLACPIVTAMLAIAQQKAGHRLGLAAPMLARMQTGLTDVVPLKSANNLMGSITDKNGTTAYPTRKIFAPAPQFNPKFVGSLWEAKNFGYTAIDFGLSFGTDYNLTVARGWDNVTGFGTPNAAFVSTAAAGK
jgi:subtilase family serine protease